MATAEDRLRQEALGMTPLGSRGVKDITAEFTQASTQLQPGELVKDEWFTLFEAVGALEIMDPKMDSGYVPPSDAFEPDFDPADPLSLPEIIWIMDQLICLELTWHDGYPLSQTIFTSLHIDRLLDPKQPRIPTLYYPAGDWKKSMQLSEDNLLAQQLLTAYCIAVVKCVSFAIELVQSQNFYEEEDLVTHTFGRDLVAGVTSYDAMGMLEEASKKLASASSISDEMKSALNARLAFRTDFLHALTEGNAPWEAPVEALKRVDQTHKLAAPLPGSFSEKVQRQLATSTPPRPMLRTSWDTARDKWTKLCQDVIAAQRLTNQSIIQTPASLHRAVWAFSSRGEPLALPRSILQDILFSSEDIRGLVPRYELILADIRNLVLPGDPLTDPASFQIEVTTDSRHVCSRLIEGFLERALEEYLNLYRMVCQNRCRIRRTFTQAIPILDAMESEAAKTDANLTIVATGLRMKVEGKLVSLDPLTSWAKYHKLRIMAWSVQLGFETEIYLPDELAGMYWFLSRLCAQRTGLLEHILRFSLDRARRIRSQNVKAEWLMAETFIKSLHDMSKITQLVSEALWRLYTALMAVDVIAAPKRDYGKDQLLYDARMKPYLTIIHDPVPQLEEFKAATHRPGSVEASCSEVDDLVKSAKQLLANVKKLTPEQGQFIGTEEEWKKEIKGLETTCVAIAVAASQVKRVCAQVGEERLKARLKCRVEKKYAEWWVVPILKEKAA